MNRGDIKQAYDRAVAHGCEDVADMIEKLAALMLAAQAREAKLIEAMNLYFDQYPHMTKGYIIDAIAQPTDNTALREMVAQAGEVMRERTLSGTTALFANRIRLLPAITLDDLK